MSKKAPAVGIDLGTTFSCVAVWQHGKVEIIPNSHGKLVTPSYVAFTETDRLIGDPAKAQVSVNPENTIFDAKRLIGRTYDDPIVQYDINLWNFNVVNEKNKPLVEVKHGRKKLRYHPEEISAMVLGNLKESAENFLGMKVTEAVVTVPAYFNDAQRQSTRDAGLIAGLDVLRIINEPTAAALAYGLEKKLKEANNILVYDLGGGTFDVSVLTIKGSHLRVLAVAGNTHLGGEDFDNCLLDYFVDEFKRVHKKDLTAHPKSLRRLRTACEEAKRNLSGVAETTVVVDNICGNIDFAQKISRARFEELCKEWFNRTLRTVKTALDDAHLDKSQIDDVVLVGGSTRIPKIRQMVTDFFDGKEPCKSIHPDEAVAYGAAIQAAAITMEQDRNQYGGQNDSIREVVLEDVTPLSLGIEVRGGLMSVVVERNTPVPCRISTSFTTVYDYQDMVHFQIYEGERVMTKGNNLLDSFILTGIPPARRGVPDLKITFEMDADGILRVKAVDTFTKKTRNVTIKNVKGRLSDVEIKRMILEAEKFRKVDQKMKDTAVARTNLESYVYDLKEKICDMPNKRDLLQKCYQVLDWLDSNQNAKKEQYEKQQRNLQQVYANVK